MRAPGPTGWLRTHDPGFVALRRATRAAIVIPAGFAVGLEVIKTPVMSLFLAFGMFAMLILADFGGPMRERIQAEGLLAVTGAALVALGTLASTRPWLAALSMAVVGFAVLFLSVVSSEFAGATTALLMSFILPVATPGPVSSIPDRLAGWGLAGAISIVAIVTLWPAPVRNPLRPQTILAIRQIAARLRANVAYRRGEPGWTAEEVVRAAADERRATGALERAFYGTPYRPGGLATATRVGVRLANDVFELSHTLDGFTPDTGEERRRSTVRDAVDVATAAAEVLEAGAALLDAPTGDSSTLDDSTRHLGAAVTRMDDHAAVSLRTPRRASSVADDQVDELVQSIEPGFHARELSFSVSRIAAYIGRIAAADRRSWWAKVVGRQPAGSDSTGETVRQAIRSHLGRHSVWLHNSLRGAAALGLAVLVADLTSVQHSFWVVLGTLAVLRSNALSTGQTLVRAMLGTSVGVVIGGVLVWLIGAHSVVLWGLMPVAVLVAAMAPAVISFAAGQVAFSALLVILFNLVVPAGWRVGLVRVEDVAIGGAVSLGVGLVFWPRGAGSELGAALAQAYSAAAARLHRTVAYVVGPYTGTEFGRVALAQVSQWAGESERRLDEAFRTFLTERGAKRLALHDASVLMAGVADAQMASEAIAELWAGRAREAEPAHGDWPVVARELLATSEVVGDWYNALAQGLLGRSAVPDPPPPDTRGQGRLIAALAPGLASPDARGDAVSALWTMEHLESLRRGQGALVGPASAAATVSSHGRGRAGDVETEPPPTPALVAT